MTLILIKAFLLSAVWGMVISFYFAMTSADDSNKNKAIAFTPMILSLATLIVYMVVSI